MVSCQPYQSGDVASCCVQGAVTLHDRESLVPSSTPPPAPPPGPTTALARRCSKRLSGPSSTCLGASAGPAKLGHTVQDASRHSSAIPGVLRPVQTRRTPRPGSVTQK